jgi:hypothetical protein
VTAQTIPDHLRIAMRLAARDPSGVQEYANTPAAVWFSFIAALITLPLFIATVVMGDKAVGGILGFVAELGPYAIGWLLFPVVMAQVARLIKRESRYCQYIVAVNWCGVVEYTVLTTLVLLTGSGVLPESISRVLFVGAVTWVLIYQFFVARVVLHVEKSVAGLIVALRLVLDLVIVAFAGTVGG